MTIADMLRLQRQDAQRRLYKAERGLREAQRTVEEFTAMVDDERETIAATDAWLSEHDEELEFPRWDNDPSGSIVTTLTGA